jgi:hypothetical protein
MAFLEQRPLPTHGYWGDITSSLLWCEEKVRVAPPLTSPLLHLPAQPPHAPFLSIAGRAT